MINRITRKVKNVIESFRREQNTQIEQIQIVNQYHLMKKLLTPSEMPSLNNVGFQVYSQYEEDGMLLYIFAVIGTTNKRVVEICAGDGKECMAANLIINHGWNGLLFDGDDRLVKVGKEFFAVNKSTWLHPPTFVHAWLTIENINQLITDNGFVDEIDLLSLDIDGNDYYIMEAINCIKPRVIICETQNVIPGDLSLTVPYKSDFNRMEGPHIDFMSVSLLAMKKMLAKKGYRLIGAHRHGFNAIFMLNGVGMDYFPEVTIESIYKDNAYTELRNATAWKEVKDLPWVKV